MIDIDRSGRIPWRRAWHPTAAFLPGESYGQKSLRGYNPQGCKTVGNKRAHTHSRFERWMDGWTDRLGTQRSVER